MEKRNLAITASVGVFLLVAIAFFGFTSYQDNREDRLDRLSSAIYSARYVGITYEYPEFRDHPKVKEALDDYHKYKDFDREVRKHGIRSFFESDDMSGQMQRNIESHNRQSEERREMLRREGW